jgi:glycosyltransferase involved in cell wall biosynthesis
MFKILVVGTSNRKNIKTIYSIASKLNNLLFIFVGHFDNFLNLKNLIIKPNVSDLELEELYKTSDLLLFPSLTEGFGLPILEAQYFGLPVITSNKEPMRSVSGSNGAILVNPYVEIEIINAILDITKNPRMADQIINFGKENIKKYHISKIIQKYSNVYELVNNQLY